MPDLSSLAVSVALILGGAGWAQAVQNPIAWPQTRAGYVDRVEDIVGARLIHGITQGSLNAAYGWRPYSAVCVRERLVPCAFERTFTGFDRYGIRRINYPLIAGIMVSSTAAVAWRPERYDPVKAMMFVGTRMAGGAVGAVAGRVIHDWIATRPVKVDDVP